MKPSKLELVAKFALQFLPYAVMCHAAYEVGAELHGALFGTDDLEPRLAFRLVCFIDQEPERFVIGNFRTVHFVIKNRVGDRSQIEFQLIEPQGQFAISIALIQHHLLGINGPAFHENPRLQYAPDFRRAPIGILELHIVSWVGFVNRQDLQQLQQELLASQDQLPTQS